MAKFSSVTIVELVDAFEFRSNASIEEFAMRFDLEDYVRESGMERKLLSIKRYLKDNPDSKGPLGSPLVQELFEYYLDKKFAWQRKSGWEIDLFTIPEKLLIALRRDGYATDGVRLIPLLPEETDLEHIESDLEVMLDKGGFTVAKEHLRQGRDDFVRGNWAGANGCFRSAVESLLIDLANKGAAIQVKKGSDAIGSLARASDPIVHKRLNEWDGQGNGFMEGFWKRLHPEGPHPGLSDEEDSTFRMQLIVVVMHYLLLQKRKRP